MAGATPLLEKVIVLRNLAKTPPAKAPLAEPFATIAASLTYNRAVGPEEAVSRKPEASAPPDVRLEVAELTRKEVLDASRAPDVLAVGSAMPTALVEPVGQGLPGAVWGLSAVGADRATATGQGVSVAVLDTGIDRDHPAFAGVSLVEQDFSGSGNGDRKGHGTHCAGTIFGRDVGGVRIGVARGVQRALIGKVLSDTGGGSSEMIFSAILWAMQQGATIISMSLGFDFPGAVDQNIKAGLPAKVATSKALEAYRANLRMFDSIMRMVADNAAFAQGTVVVAAAGNESSRPAYVIGASLPAAAENVVSVGALGQAGPGGYSVAPFSNTYPQVVAPGVDITSALPGGGLGSLSGTSMACPHVAGVAALWWEAVQAVPVAVRAKTVQAKLLAMSRGNVFAPGGDAADWGDGLVTAP